NLNSFEVEYPFKQEKWPIKFSFYTGNEYKSMYGYSLNLENQSCINIETKLPFNGSKEEAFEAVRVRRHKDIVLPRMMEILNSFLDVMRYATRNINASLVFRNVGFMDLREY